LLGDEHGEGANLKQVAHTNALRMTLAAALSSAALAQSSKAPDVGAEQAVILDGAMRMVADEYVAVGGNDGLICSKEEMSKRWAEDFASPHPVNQCVSRPTTIEVGQAG